MDILKMLDELRSEWQQIAESILVLERLAAGARGKRRGRPPKCMAEAQKKRWAAKRAAAKE